MKKYFPLFFLIVVVFSFFIPSLMNGRLPIPADTIVGLYHPYRDLYASEYPNGIPFKNFLTTDPVRQQYPWKYLTIAAVKNGALPLWNPYSFAGYPLLGNFQSGAFYPLNLIFLIVPFSFGWTIAIYLQPILGSIFLYYYLRNLRISMLGSIFGGFVFAYSGFFVSWLEWGNILHTALWLPLVLLSIDKLCNKDNLRSSNFQFSIFNFHLKIREVIFWSLIFTVSMCSSFFAGHLQTFFYLSLVTIAYLIFRWWEHGQNKKIFLLFALSSFLFAILTFIQWYPTLQFIGESARAIDQADWNQPGWFLPWQHLIQFLAPDYFGNPSTLNYYGVWNYGEFIGYIGIFPLLLSLCAVLFRRDKETWFFAVLILLSLLFALPTIIAKIPFIMSLPFIGTAQPTRLLFVVDFSLAVLCAFGFDYFQKKGKNIAYPLIILLGLFGVVWGITLVTPSLIPGLIENISVAKRNLQLPTLLLFGVVMISIIFMKTKNEQLRVILILSLFMLTVADISRFAGKFTPFTSSEYLFPQTKTLTFLQQNLGYGRYMALDSRIFPPNFSVMYELQSIEGYDPLYLKRYAELIAASERKKPDISQPLGFHRIITPHEPNSDIVNLLGVKYILSMSDISYPQFRKVFQEGQTRVYENVSVLPRAFFVENVHEVQTGSDQAILEFLFEEGRMLRNHAVVEGDLSQSTFSSGSAQITQYSPNRVAIRVNNQSTGFLVLTDTFYPTWKAQLQNESGGMVKQLQIYRTDYNFRGVIVPSGEYIVEFSNHVL